MRSPNEKAHGRAVGFAAVQFTQTSLPMLFVLIFTMHGPLLAVYVSAHNGPIG